MHSRRPRRCHRNLAPSNEDDNVLGFRVLKFSSSTTAGYQNRNPGAVQLAYVGKRLTYRWFQGPFH